MKEYFSNNIKYLNSLILLKNPGDHNMQISDSKLKQFQALLINTLRIWNKSIVKQIVITLYFQPVEPV